MGRILLWIHLTFLFLVLSLSLLVAAYWYRVLEPRLQQEAGSNAALLAQAQSVRLADALSGAGGSQRKARLTESMDEILAFSDPGSGTPFFHRLTVELDYDAVSAEPGSLDLQRGVAACTDCLQAEVPVFDPDTFELLGLAHFWVSDRFFRQLSGDIRRNMLAEAGWALGILVLVWASVVALVVQLQRQTRKRRRAEQALSRNQQRYQRLLDGISGYFVYSRNRNGRFEFVSDSVEKVMGVTPGRFIEDIETWLTDEESRRLLAKNLGMGLSGMPNAAFEIVLHDGMGRARYIECSETPLKDADGTVKALEGIARDITPQRALMGELRTAKERAEAANQTKSRFLANVSHEIRTPMNAVIGLTGLMEDTELSARQRDYLEKIQSSARSLLEIINDILDISKIEADSMELESVDFSLDDVLHQLANVVQVKAREKGLELVFDSEPGVPARLRGDPLRLGQILLNLANNAVKFTNAGEILVRTELVEDTGEHWVLAFTVRDSGVGIEADKLPTLFDAFSQADSSNTRVYGGTGLGLAICKRLVAMMQGSIEAVSEPGQGSSFRFKARFQRPRSSGGAPRITPAGLRGLHTLVVDDNKLSREILSNALASFSLDVNPVASGSAALQALDEDKRKGHPYGLVLMDWKMPGLDGLETTRRLRNDPELQEDQPKVILVSAYSQEHPEEAAGGGVDAFLAKPVSQSALFDTVLRALGLAAEPQPAHTREPDRANEGFCPGTRVLLVEDNPINQQIALELLQKAGLEAKVAGDGAQALLTLRQETFSVVLMDVQMPVMDGMEATRRLRADARLKDLPVIAMTAHAMAGDEQRCLDAGMNDYISKPVDAARLIRLLHRWIPDAVGPTRARPPAETTKTTVDTLPELPGIDVALALRRASGNLELMQRLHRLFVQSYGDGAERLRRMLEQGQTRDAAALAHTIKGVAGGVAANGIAAAALALEQAMEKQEDWDTALRDLERELATVSAIGPNPSRGPESGREQGAGKAPDKAALQSCLEELKQHLDNNNMQALNSFSRLQGLLPADTGFQTGLNELQSLIEQLDFARAGERLQQLAERFE